MNELKYIKIKEERTRLSKELNMLNKNFKEKNSISMKSLLFSVFFIVGAFFTTPFLFSIGDIQLSYYDVTDNQAALILFPASLVILLLVYFLFSFFDFDYVTDNNFFKKILRRFRLKKMKNNLLYRREQLNISAKINCFTNKRKHLVEKIEALSLEEMHLRKGIDDSKLQEIALEMIFNNELPHSYKYFLSCLSVDKELKSNLLKQREKNLINN